MANVILFHHVQGLTEGILILADQLRETGHHVTVPDLFGGVTFDTIEAGLGYVEDRGFEAVIGAGEEAANTEVGQIVYAGFSLGALISHKLAQTRPEAAGALLFHHGDVPVSMFGDSWPEGVDIQIHISEHDEWFEPETVDQFIETVGAVADADLYLYPGSTHLFTDSSLIDYNPNAAELAMQRTITFLDSHP
jgi:dienelactone hydrolase